MARGKQKREYPPEVVKHICGLYESGMTVAEIIAVAPKGYRVQTILERYLPERRKAAKRDQSGERNHSWKGSEAGYQALHLRVQAQRGTPSRCSACDRSDSDTTYEWANITGDYANLRDFVRLCVTCHRQIDTRMRKRLGAPLSAHVKKEGDANV